MKIINLVSAFLLLFFPSSSFAQFNSTKTWVVGDSILINFNTLNPTTSASSMDSFEGLSCISDNSGDLLFYTNGIYVWNANHQLMPNGFGLNSHISATNAALVVPMPGNSNLYYIFTVGAYAGQQGGFGGVAYSVVNITADSGRGDVITKNVILYTKSTEKLCGTKHANGVDYWILTHDFSTDNFRAFLLTSSGISPDTVISKVGSVHYEFPVGDWGSHATGSMRFSPSGCKVALVLAAGQKDTVQIFDFDNATGYVFNPISLKAGIVAAGSVNNPYSLSFSPDNSKLYVTSRKYLLQFNLISNIQSIIQVSKTIIASHNMIVSGYPTFHFEDIQIAPDGKIYIVRMLTSYLSCLNNPNEVGSLVNFVDTAIYFPGFQIQYGLPNFVQNYTIPDSITFSLCEKYCPDINLVNDSIICEGDTISINLNLPLGNVLWNTGETSNFINISTPGIYSVIYDFNGCPTKNDSITIYLTPKPEITIPDTTLCILNEFIINIPEIDSTTYTWSNNIYGPQFITTESGNFILFINHRNCLFNEDFEVINYCESILEFPNIFTPNGDGFNDHFIPILFENIFNPILVIYNRWGNEIFRSNNLITGWNGLCGDKICNDGIYFWHIEFLSINNDFKKLSGFLKLIND